MITNKLNLPAPLVRAAEQQQERYSKGDAHESVTGLIAPPRQRMLKMINEDGISEDVSDLIWSIIGSALHRVLEDANDGLDCVSEKRLYVTMGGWRISGAFDLYTKSALANSGKISDWKMTTVNSVMYGKRKPEWDQQLNCYAYLAKRNGISVDALEVVPILRDWTKSKARQGRGYPPHNAMTIQIPLWEDSYTEKWMLERIRLHQSAMRDGLPDCTPEERWARGSKFAVTKGDRAVKGGVFDTRRDAEALLAKQKPGHFIEERPGGSTRCKDYCSVMPFCAQARKLAIIEGWEKEEV